MTESIAALAAALAKVQAELPDIERDRTVEVRQKSGDTYSYSYVTLAKLSKAVLPLLAKQGLAFAVMPSIGADGKLSVCYHLMHESGEKLSGEFPISAEGGIQVVGGRITYIRRYCLAAIVGVAADEDDEARLANEGAPRTAQRNNGRQQQAAAPEEGKATAARRQAPAAGAPLPGESELITQPQMRKMQVLFGEQGYGTSDDKRAFIINIIGRELASAKELTKDEAKLVIDRLETREDPAAAGDGR